MAKQYKSTVLTFEDDRVPTRTGTPGIPGLSLAPWREWLEDMDTVREPHGEGVYPIDKRR